MNETRCDVLIVGAGGAALRAAIAAHKRDHNLRVLVATKGELGHSGVTAWACSDRMAFHATLKTTEPGGDDAWVHHADDVYRIGGHVSDGDLAEVLAKNAEDAFDDLDRWGVPFARKPDGTVDQFVTDGSEYARACYTGPYTANHIEEALVRQIQQLPIDIMEHTLVAELLPSTDGRRVAGAIALDERTGERTLIRAKAIVLATGGAGGAFDVNVFPKGMTGDGMAMAFRLGAELVNMEFIQIGLSSVKTKLACSGSMMRAIPRMVNDQGIEFLPNYFPQGTDMGHIYSVLFAKGASWPVSWREPSHVIDIAVYYERAAGRKVFMDYGTNPVGYEPKALSDKVRNWYHAIKGVNLDDLASAGTPMQRLAAINPQIVQWLGERGIDLWAGEMVEIAPAIQHFQGGIKIRTHGETTIPGLYAAGETAGGQHGANRPGGNALLDSQVFGKISGNSAAEDALALDDCPEPDHNAQEKALAWLEDLGRDNDRPAAFQVRAKAQALLGQAASVVRHQARLEEAAAELQAMLETGMVAGRKSLAYTVETANALLVGLLVVTAAKERHESRGPHLMFARFGDREPLPRDDEHWTRYIVLKKDDGSIQTKLAQPVPR